MYNLVSYQMNAMLQDLKNIDSLDLFTSKSIK
jgi:hypothetical protein